VRAAAVNTGNTGSRILTTPPFWANKITHRGVVRSPSHPSRRSPVVVSLVLVEGDDVLEEDLMIPLANVEEFLIGRVDGFGFLVHFVANSTPDYDATMRAFRTEVPNVTGVLTHATRESD
jgi:hypothetical protein